MLRIDLRQSLRGLAARPWLTLVIVSTLALGIGANAAVFSVIDALRPIPQHWHRGRSGGVRAARSPVRLARCPPAGRSDVCPGAGRARPPGRTTRAHVSGIE